MSGTPSGHGGDAHPDGDREPTGDADNSGAAACVFCTRVEQPDVLFETEHLYVMPDKFPTTPGHCLVIAKEHLSCYAAAPKVLGELVAAKERVARFLLEVYRGEVVYAMEHGVVGQTVFHAHLHVLVGPHVPLPEGYREHPDVRRIQGWEPVVEWYREAGHYRYVEYAGERFLVESRSELIALGRPWLSKLTGMQWDEARLRWRKYTTPEDVRETERRWREWESN